MEIYKGVIIIIFALINLIFFVKGYIETKRKKAYNIVPYPFFVFGIFVWGDAVVISMFLFLSSLLSFVLNDWILFLLLISVFWLVRSLGETMYWFNQQFSSINRNPPKKLAGFRIYQNDSIWFAYQIFHQCIVVITIITTIYLAYLWLA